MLLYNGILCECLCVYIHLRILCQPCPFHPRSTLPVWTSSIVTWPVVTFSLVKTRSWRSPTLACHGRWRRCMWRRLRVGSLSSGWPLSPSYLESLQLPLMCGHMEWRCGKLALWVNTFIAVLAARFNTHLFVVQVIYNHYDCRCTYVCLGWQERIMQPKAIDNWQRCHSVAIEN